MKDEVLLKKLKAAFKLESEERIQNISENLIKLENAVDKEEQKNIIEIIFREAHSLKGAARAVNLTEIESLCQNMESVFAVMKKETESLSHGMFDVFHKCVSVIEQLMTDDQDEKESVKEKEISQLIEKLSEFISRKTVKKKDHNKNRDEAFTGVTSGKSEKKQKSTIEHPKLPETIKLSAEKLDLLLRKTEELISVKLFLNQHQSDLNSVSTIFENWKKDLSAGEEKDILSFYKKTLDHVNEIEKLSAEFFKKTAQQAHQTGRMIDDLLDEIKSIMMLPFSSLCSIFPRMVREISRNIGKEIRLKIEGESIEVDRRILEQMKDPLTHLIRNSIDHGIEQEETRKAAGKPSYGTIVLQASRVEGSKIQIIVKDDGRGIDIEKVKKKAVTNGILSEKEAAALSDKDAVDLIFQSGISTAAIVSDLSGRGLGMAIVKENIEKTGGHFSIENKPGKGTEFKILLPVTIATFKGVLIKLNHRFEDRFFVIPANRVIKVLKIKKNLLGTVENRENILMDNRPVSLVSLADILGIEPDKSTEKENENASFLKVVIIGTMGKNVAFKVDDILGEQEVLVKDLGPQLEKVKYVLAVSILANGSLVPVLNTADLIESTSETFTGRAGVQDLQVSENKKTASILVADDSMTSRMLIKNVLEAGGYKVKTAVDGKDALTTLKTEPFDLLISDIEMPEMNGFELTKALRNDPAFSALPVILVTSLESRQDKEKGIDAGASAYIIKRDFDQNNLMEVIERFV